MFSFSNRKLLFIIFVGLISARLDAQKLLPFKLPDSGVTSSYTSTAGEDADFTINPPSFIDNGDGTVTDNVTGLMWQKADGGEMTYESALVYNKTFTLGGYSDWRLPTSKELFSINNLANLNPALNTTYFTKTAAEYWWTSERRIDDTTKVWAVNAGGGVGAHPKNETVSAGGIKFFHVRLVRTPITSSFAVSHFTDNGDGTVTDNYTGLVWQKIQNANLVTWEEALAYANSLTLGGKSDWRVPNIKELYSISDEKLSKPSFDKVFFTNVLSGNYWSSTTMFNPTTKAWDINVDYGIVSYNDKTIKENVILVRGGNDKKYLNVIDVPIPAGIYDMGDHFNFVDPAHPSDETPIHSVKVDSFYMVKTETTNQQFVTFLNSYLIKGLVEVKSNVVYLTGDTNIICYTNAYGSYYSIAYDGKVFVISDFRANHPVVGSMWYGDAAYCNWLSIQSGLQECYNLKTWECDFTKTGYRLPTEAEWEWAGRGGNINPYFNYANGNTIDIAAANLPASGDPYEVTAYPNTTPVGFYDGKLHLKTEYNWPGAAASYQTSNGANAYGLCDMQGNVWELLNDWYGQNYYSLSTYDNPKGPTSGFIMPDGKPYRGMRGGNWYNGLTTNGVNDGHSRISNRNPSYYRGPQDPVHPWYHVGFRIARKYTAPTGVNESYNQNDKSFRLFQNYPNPFNPSTTISYSIQTTSRVTITVSNSLGQEVARLYDGIKNPGRYNATWNGSQFGSGVYFCTITDGLHQSAIKMILIK